MATKSLKCFHFKGPENKDMLIIPTSLPYTKISSKWINDLNIRTKPENKEVNLHDSGFGNGFSDMMPKAKAAKEKINWTSPT